jgi:hypothetical protein
LLPHIEEIFAMELRDGPESAEYKDVEHTTTLGRFFNTKPFSDFGRRFIELVKP